MTQVATIDKKKQIEEIYSNSSEDDPDEEPIIKYVEEKVEWDKESFLKTKSMVIINEEFEEKLKVMDENQRWD
jgi:hypothetical protein